MEDFQIEFYRTEHGNCPVEDFLDQLDDKMLTKVLRMISLLKNFGNDLREPYSKHLKDGIFELRISQGSNISRILYFLYLRGSDCSYQWVYQKDTKNTGKRN